jgi:hypothetical protein
MISLDLTKTIIGSSQRFWHVVYFKINNTRNLEQLLFCQMLKVHSIMQEMASTRMENY